MVGLFKRSFPRDWSDLSDDQIAENIQYLLKHYYNYNVKCPEHNYTGSVYVGNVRIRPNLSNQYTYIVNNKEITKDNNEYVYYNTVLLYDLGKMCATYTDTEKNKVIIRYVKILLVGVGLMLASQIFYKIKQDKQPVNQENLPVKQEQLNKDISWIDYRNIPKKYYAAQNTHSK